jgi:hypothetical protein
VTLLAPSVDSIFLLRSDPAGSRGGGAYLT